MKIVFFGTPAYVLPILEKVNKTFKDKDGERPIVAVVTQKPKLVGRNKKLSYSAIDTWAFKRKIPVYFEPHDLIKNKVQMDMGILASFGQIISSDILKLFPLGILNVHPSLLPEFRGPTPVPATIITNSKAGATIIKIDSKMDHGPIIAKFADVVTDEDTTQSLRDRLFARSADVLAELLPAYTKGKITPKAQDENEASFTKLMTKEHGFLPFKALLLARLGKTYAADWQIPFVKDLRLTFSPTNIDRFVRAVTPWPGVWTTINTTKGEKRLKIISTQLVDDKLVINKVQVEGKTEVSWRQFSEAYKTAIDL